MPEITVDTGDGPIGAVLEMPSGDGPWPAVVVAHDLLGLSVDIKNIVRRIADAGYLVLAPNLYSRGGRARCVTRVFRELIRRDGRAIDDLLAARTALIDREDCTGAVAIVGFCMGGGFALAMAPKGFDVSAPFYGVLPRHLDQALNGSCPIVASFGTRDPVLRGAGPALERSLGRLGVAHDVKTYPGVGHSFANRLPVPAPLLRITGFAYGPDETEDAWRRVFAFLDAHLPGTG
ncbi:dienelactone hydrolase family protein [Rhodococcus sp. NPDC058514]|uniref:dienelactone hydrolase family protein n=1 Tax=unclassified Rhodococcus (in: high G+C Gram-positive bacteria) TaxID=192944 RepID=UPI0036692816